MKKKMRNSKSIRLFEIPITNLDIQMRRVCTCFGYSRMPLELGDKMKTKLPSEIKILSTITNGDHLKQSTL